MAKQSKSQIQMGPCCWALLGFPGVWDPGLHRPVGGAASRSRGLKPAQRAGVWAGFLILTKVAEGWGGAGGCPVTVGKSLLLFGLLSLLFSNGGEGWTVR